MTNSTYTFYYVTFKCEGVNNPIIKCNSAKEAKLLRDDLRLHGYDSACIFKQTQTNKLIARVP